MIPLLATAALLLSGQAAQSTPAPAAPEAASPTTTVSPSSRDSGAWTASDEAISRGLVSAWRATPNRRVCATYTATGSHVPISVCGTLESFFAGRTRAEVAGQRAPSRLIDEVKRQRLRARNMAS